MARYGSSPLTRGKRRTTYLHENVGRLIPAHAGKTLGGLGEAAQGGAHPRSRGENLDGCHQYCHPSGSSPLTRGKPVACALGTLCPRLIPAHAGKTATDPYSRETLAAHPRSRGENGSAPSIISVRSGSSPLTRGKPDPYSYAAVKRGLIPAHAGKTMRPDVTPRGHRAHPRSRGENVNGAGAAAFSSGSSPLTRGKLSEEVGCPPY